MALSYADYLTHDALGLAALVRDGDVTPDEITIGSNSGRCSALMSTS